MTINYTAIDIGLDQLRTYAGNLQEALRSPHARTETALAWLFLELQDNTTAIQAIRCVAQELDDAFCPVPKKTYQAAKVAAAARFTRVFLAGISRRARVG